MISLQSFNHLLHKLDRLSPLPVLYPFVMSEQEKALFDRYIRESKYFLEFGAGGSTIRTLQKSKAIVHSIESSMEWIDTMRKYYVIRRYENRRLFFHHVEIGPVGDWGFPVGNEQQELFPQYSAGIFGPLDSEELDVVFIDGRFRVACTLHTILACHANGSMNILIHDFWKRSEYHIVLKYLEVVDQADTLGVFTIKKNINIQAVQADYQAYKYQPL